MRPILANPPSPISVKTATTVKYTRYITPMITPAIAARIR